tara:strand:+ start:241 stop:429 length:189 start_codon:yes stop_codon:yes gene_type:complete
LIKLEGKDPTIDTNPPSTTSRIAVSTKRSFQMYFTSIGDFYHYNYSEVLQTQTKFYKGFELT